MNERLRIGRSITSNVEKLISCHPDSLEKIANGENSPILLHLSPTNVCDSACIHCCFSGRDKTLNLPFDLLKDSINQFKELGIKSVEFTGGGEPTMYGFPERKWLINPAIEYVVDKQNLALGMNTNGLNVERITEENWKKFSWVRVALNVFDSKNEKRIEKFKENVQKIKELTNVTACYIVPREIGFKNLEAVVEYANKENITTRIAPDCIQTCEEIANTTNLIRKNLNSYGNQKKAILSDFNIYLFERKNKNCMSPVIKPFLFTDGFVYACPSSELAPENGRTMQPKFKICHGSEVIKTYKNLIFKKQSCSYCKYSAQNDFLQKLIQTGSIEEAYIQFRKESTKKDILQELEEIKKTKFNDKEFV
jgi:MoaA/NifB/PqqE/SkfB family radical SAM enzyme